MKYAAPVQLELSLFGDRSLRTATIEYLARNAFRWSDATLGDYRDRGEWCMREFGADRDIATIGYDDIDLVVTRSRFSLKQVTLKKRISFLRAVLKLAKHRKLIVEVPDAPRLQDDGERKTALHTVEQWQIVRELLPDGLFRRFYDLGFWTGHHTQDLFTMERWMLDVRRPIKNEAGEEVGRGMFLRRNHKNPRMTPVWLPMEPELKLVLPQILAGVGVETSLVMGELWNVRRTLHMACDRAVAAGHDVPRVSAIDLRRSYASMLTGRGYRHEFVRIALGHIGELQPNLRTARPTTAQKHYMHATPGLISSVVTRA